jgi:hypothetical protein
MDRPVDGLASISRDMAPSICRLYVLSQNEKDGLFAELEGALD